jgi:hypothetical protein
MRTVRQIVACARRGGLPPGAIQPGNLSVVRDVFGHVWRPKLQSEDAPMSVLEQAERLQGGRIHLNIILVGSDAFTPVQRQRIENALYFGRKLLATGGLGVGRVERYGIQTADAHGYDHLADDCEAFDLPDQWTVHNDGLDVFIVRQVYWEHPGQLLGAGGQTTTDGPCDKDNVHWMNGIVLGGGGGPIGEDVRAHSLAYHLVHEIGHYLGLSHIVDEESTANATPAEARNIMWPGFTDLVETFSTEDRETLHDHCFSYGGC